MYTDYTSIPCTCTLDLTPAGTYAACMHRPRRCCDADPIIAIALMSCSMQMIALIRIRKFNSWGASYRLEESNSIMIGYITGT